MRFKSTHVHGIETKLPLKLTVLCLKEKDSYDCYLKKEGTSYKFMFGLPIKQQSFFEANVIAVNNALDYLDLFEEDEL